MLQTLSAIILFSSSVLAQNADEEKARQLAAIITEQGAIEQYCGSDNGPPYPGSTDAETEAACDIIANSEDD